MADGLFPDLTTTGSQKTSEASAESEYIASRMDGLPVGPTLSYTFETQASVPYDGTNELARRLSPFTLRLVVPEALIPADSGVDVNLIGRGSKTVSENNALANELRQAIGQRIIYNATTSEGEGRLTQLNSTLSAGRVLQTTLGTDNRSVLADNVMVADILYQVERMLQTPPLTLFVNPSDMSITYTAVQQYSQRTRWGKVFERWGEGQPTMTISGSTGAWCAGQDPSAAMGFPSQGGENHVATGVQFATKRDSAAFQQFMSLYHLYRNNGYIYDTVEGSEAHLFIGAVAIDYDQMTYIGNIDSFSYSYADDDSHRIQWEMAFTVGRMYDHAESPIVVLPESSPSVTPGSFSTDELMREMAGTPTRTDIADAGIGAQLVGVSGTQQFTGGITGESTDEEIEAQLTQQLAEDKKKKDPDPDSTTPLEALGAFFTPSGMFEP